MNCVGCLFVLFVFPNYVKIWNSSTVSKNKLLQSTVISFVDNYMYNVR